MRHETFIPPLTAHPHGRKRPVEPQISASCAASAFCRAFFLFPDPARDGGGSPGSVTTGPFLARFELPPFLVGHQSPETALLNAARRLS